MSILEEWHLHTSNCTVFHASFKTTIILPYFTTNQRAKSNIAFNVPLSKDNVVQRNLLKYLITTYVELEDECSLKLNSKS